LFRGLPHLNSVFCLFVKLVVKTTIPNSIFDTHHKFNIKKFSSGFYVLEKEMLFIYFVRVFFNCQRLNQIFAKMDEFQAAGRMISTDSKHVQLS